MHVSLKVGKTRNLARSIPHHHWDKLDVISMFILTIVLIAVAYLML